MNWRGTIVRQRMRLHDISRVVFLMLSLTSVTLTGSEASRRSVENLESIKTGDEALAIPNDSKILKIESSNNGNSPALNSFLKNVLQAQDELKWIDQAVRRTGTKETQEKTPARYLRSSFHTPASRYHSKIRFKRRSGPHLDDDDSWRSTKRRYSYDDDKPERVYLDDENMKVKRHANPSAIFDAEGYESSRTNEQRRSAIDDGEPVDDSWGKKEGLEVPGEWFQSGEGIRKPEDTPVESHWSRNDYANERRKIGGLNRIYDLRRSADDRVENSRDEREARSPSRRRRVDEPTLESLKNTVLELRKSLEDSDKKMDSLSEKQRVSGVVKNRERHADDIPERKEEARDKATPAFISDDKTLRNEKSDLNSHYDPETNSYEESEREDPEESRMELSSGSNWWEDPRSAVDMFDFKRREDDEDDEDDDDEDPEFDYMTRRVKREKDMDGVKDQRVRVYRRAGFGELYPKEESYEEKGEEVMSGKADRVYREIRGAAGRDKINEERNSDGGKSGDRKIADINVNENENETENENENKNGHSVSGDDKAEEIKKFGNDNPAEKSGVLKSVEENRPGEKAPETTVGDSNLEEKKKPGFLSQDEKRSSSFSSSFPQGLSAEEISRVDSAQKKIKSRLCEPVKKMSEESAAENISREKIDDEKKGTRNTVEKNREVEKSEPTDDNVHKLSQLDSNESKKHKDQEDQKDTKQDEKASDHAESSGKQKSDKKETGIEAENEMIKIHSAELGAASTADKMTGEIHVKNESEDVAKPNSPELFKGDHEPGISSPEVENTDGKDLKENERTEKKSENEVASSLNQIPGELSEDRKSKQEENAKQQDSRVYKSDQRTGEEDRQILANEVKDVVSKREALTRKLLWSPDESRAKEGGSKDVEIRDGRRDSAWDQNRGEKSGQRPANFLKNSQAGQRLKNYGGKVKFVKRSLMVAKDNIADPEAADMQKRDGSRSTIKDSASDRRGDTDSAFGDKSKQLGKRSVKFYRENVEQDKQDELQSDEGKLSLGKIIERRKEPDLAEDAYEIEDDGVSRAEQNFKDAGVNNEGEGNQAVESEVSFSHQGKDRDPMRDRINMLIKQKLDDRGKGKLTHFKREANRQVSNIEYYDYDSDVNGAASDGDSIAIEDNQQIPDQNNSTYHEVATDRAPESITKTDENAEEERREEAEREEGKCKAPKEEFISDVELAKTQTTQNPPSSNISTGLELPEKSHRRFDEDGGVEEAHVNNDINERRDNQAAKSNSHWLGQPAEADPEQDQDSIDRQDRYREAGESVKREKAVENERTEVLDEPLEYSVNVHGKLDPESIDAVLNEKAYAKEKDLVENEKRSDKVQTGTDEDWKCDGLKGNSLSQSDQKIDEDEYERDQQYGEKSPGRNWQHVDSARIEEGTNDRAPFQNSFSHKVNLNPDQIIEGLYPQETAIDEDVPSGAVKLVEDSDRDSLPTMLDRSGPGERTYLVIAPAQVQCPRKQIDANENANANTSSSSSGSNYLALKVTDDMFKGGVEQGNPIDDKISDGNLMGKTTTEWKVIKMVENAKTNNHPHFENLGSLPNEILKIDSNLGHDDDSRSLKSLAVNPQDVVQESIVDPEEMAGDFDDDTRPRFGRNLKCLRKPSRHFGRNLQSVSYPMDPFQGVHQTADSDAGEKPVDKYLENTQTSFTNSEATGHRIVKRSVSLGHKETENLSEVENPVLNSEEKNLTGIVKVEKIFEKRSFGLATPVNTEGENGTEIDKDKRGLTNVEEWEMNAPTVQKQHPIPASQNTDTLLEDFGGKEASDIRQVEFKGEKRNADLESTPKTLLSNSYNTLTSGFHERESRSVKLGDENFGSDLLSVRQELLPVNNRRSKINREKKSYSNSATRSKDSNPLYDYNLGSAKSVRNSGIGHSSDWKKSSPDEDIKATHRQSKSNDYWRPNHARRKSANEGVSNHRHHQHTGVIKHHNKGLRSKEILPHGTRESLRDSTDSKAQLKSIKGHREEDFEEVEGDPVPQHGKSHNKMMADATDHSHNNLQSKSSQTTGEGYDSGNAEPKGEKKVLDENAGDPAKVKPELDDPQKKKFKVLLAADNMEDESQMDLALHGELAGKIVERIFDQVQKNDALKVALGPGLYRKHKSEDAIATDKIYRQGLDEDEVKHTEGMMRRVMELLGRLILDEVQRKTCASLPPDMREFLQWMLGVEDEDRTTDQVPPLPFIHNQEPNHRQDDKFLFENPSKHYENADVDELYKKVRLLKSLINEYNALTDKEKTKVQTVHDYLVRQLGLLLDYIEKKQAEESTGAPQRGGSIGGGHILQYQNAVPNANGSMTGESTLSPLVNTPSILMLSNASFVEPPRGSNHLVRTRLRETRSSEEEVEKKHRKRKHGKHKHSDPQEHDQRKQKHKRKKKKKKKKKKKQQKKKKPKSHEHQKPKDAQSPEYRKLIRRAAMLRKKRANLYEDNWDPIDSGYEEPAIYTSTGELTNKRRRSFWKDGFEGSQEKGDPHFWADVLAGKPDSDEEFDEKLSSDVNQNEKGRISNEPNLGMRNSKESRDVDFQKDLSFGNSKTKRDSSGVEKDKEGKSATGSQIKRDVLSASIALQPWLNPRPDDLVSSEYLKDLTTRLVHGSLVPPIYPGDHIAEDEKREADITEGRNLADDEVALLTKREAWKAENEQQLEEVAFGKDMRGKWKEKEQFQKLTEMDKKKNSENGGKRRKREGGKKNSLLKTRDVDSGLKKSKSQGNVVTVKNIEDKIADEAVKSNYRIRKNALGEVKLPEEVNPLKKDTQENIHGNVTLDDKNYQNIQNSTEIKENEKKIEKSEEGDKNVSSKEKNREGETRRDEKFEKGERALKKNEFLSLVKSIASKKATRENFKGISKSGKGSAKHLESLKEKRSSAQVTPELEGSAILPLLEISEQRQEQKQAAKTEKDDQRDIADQMLGYSSPLILNTY